MSRVHMQFPDHTPDNTHGPHQGRATCGGTINYIELGTPPRRGVFRQSYGGHSERETPGPIPNPEVKPFSADGTATERLWESRTPPDILLKEGPP